MRLFRNPFRPMFALWRSGLKWYYSHMKNSPRIAILVFSAACLSAQAQTGTPIPQLAKFDTAMVNLLNQYQVPGGQLAITYHGRLVYNRGFGYADTASHTPVNPGSLFRLASLSKQITSITLMHMIEKGKLQLSDTVFGPHGILKDSIYAHAIDARVYTITVQQLLEHAGGWNSSISGDPMFNAYAIALAMGVPPPADPVSIIRYVFKNQMLDFAPGAQYQYSNFGYSILGRVIEKLTGQKYEDYVRSEILLPLHITTMRQGSNLREKKLPDEVEYYDYPNAPKAYSVYDGTTLVPWPYGGFNLEAMDSQGAWVSSAEDLCRLLVAVDGFPTVPDILAPASIATMTKPSSANAYYALGWQVNTLHNWWHTGSLPGTVTEIVRGDNQMNWAILLNTRPAVSGPLFDAVDLLVWNVLPAIKEWPAQDLFAPVTKIRRSGLSSVPHSAEGRFSILLDAPSLDPAIEVRGLSGRSLRGKASRPGAEITLSPHSSPGF